MSLESKQTSYEPCAKEQSIVYPEYENFDEISATAIKIKKLITIKDKMKAYFFYRHTLLKTATLSRLFYLF